MSKEIGYTFCIRTRKPKDTYVFCKWFTTVEQAVEYALGELKDRSQYDVEYILIREGVNSADDPIIWDSRVIPVPKQAKSLNAHTMDIYARVVEQDALFFKQLMKTMTPEQINRFCFENGFAVPTPDELKELRQ